MDPRSRQHRLNRERPSSPSIAPGAMADLPAPVPMRQYSANLDLYLMTQAQPRHGVNWAAHGRWVKVPGLFIPPGDARTYGWSRGLRITRPEGWERRLRDRNERGALLMATYVDEADWFNYFTVPRRLRDRNERVALLMATYVDEADWFNYFTVPL